MLELFLINLREDVSQFGRAEDKEVMEWGKTECKADSCRLRGAPWESPQEEDGPLGKTCGASQTRWCQSSSGPGRPWYSPRSLHSSPSLRGPSPHSGPARSPGQVGATWPTISVTRQGSGQCLPYNSRDGTHNPNPGEMHPTLQLLPTVLTTLWDRGALTWQYARRANEKVPVLDNRYLASLHSTPSA